MAKHSLHQVMSVGCILTKEIGFYSNQKTWQNREIHSLLKSRSEDFKSYDPALIRRPRIIFARLSGMPREILHSNSTKQVAGPGSEYQGGLWTEMGRDFKQRCLTTKWLNAFYPVLKRQTRVEAFPIPYWLYPMHLGKSDLLSQGSWKAASPGWSP